MKGRYNTKQNHSSGTSFANEGRRKPLKVAPESLNSLGIGGSGGADPPVRIRLPREANSSRSPAWVVRNEGKFVVYSKKY